METNNEISIQEEIANFELDLNSDTHAIEPKVTEKTYYFAVPQITGYFSQKAQLKKYLEENGFTNYQVIKGRCLKTSAETITKIKIG